MEPSRRGRELDQPPGARYNRGTIETTLALAPERWVTVTVPDPALLEQVAMLRLENAVLRAQNAALQARICELEARVVARADGVEPTNNSAERALRPAVLWRKGSFGSESAAG